MMIRRYQQASLYDTLVQKLLPETNQQMWEEWMVAADELLGDEQVLDLVAQALAKRFPQSRRRGRPSTPAEVIMRLLVLKHARDWSFETLEREVKANLAYRKFTRIGGEKVPDAKTMIRLANVIGPDVVRQIHDRVVELAARKKKVHGRKMRVDTTVVETNIHYPTDGRLLGDGVRVITRLIGRIEKELGQAGSRVRNRMRSVGRRLMELGRASRSRVQMAEGRLKRIYGKLLGTTRAVVREAEKVLERVECATKRAVDPFAQATIHAIANDLAEITDLTRRVIRQTRARIFEGNTHYPDKLVSLFEPQTEIIRKGKAGKPTEFGNVVKIQEAEGQLIVDYEVFAKRPADQHLLIPSIEKHIAVFGRAPALAAGDGGFYSARGVKQVEQLGVKRIAIPNYASRDPAVKQQRKQRWFRRAQRWRVGSEGRISVIKRRNGLRRCRYKGHSGMERYVGWGVIANNLVASAG